MQSPYVAQVQLLRDRLDEIPEAKGVEIATIDSFQGREADAVIISMVWHIESNSCLSDSDHIIFRKTDFKFLSQRVIYLAEVIQRPNFRFMCYQIIVVTWHFSSH